MIDEHTLIGFSDDYVTCLECGTENHYNGCKPYQRPVRCSICGCSNWVGDEWIGKYQQHIKEVIEKHQEGKRKGEE